MGKTTFKLNRKGVAELMKSEPMQSILEQHARVIANRAGGGFASDLYVGKNRANASVYAKTAKAKRENKKNNTLLKALK